MRNKDIKLTLKYYVGISDEAESRILEYMENLHQEINQSERHEQNKIHAKKIKNSIAVLLQYFHDFNQITKND